jgi:hypothetical protein
VRRRSAREDAGNAGVGGCPCEFPPGNQPELYPLYPLGNSHVALLSLIIFPPASVGSVPTRGWASPAGSVRVEPVVPHVASSPRSGVSKPPLCYVCYQLGHYLADCPMLSEETRRLSQRNREAHMRTNPPHLRGPPSHSGYGITRGAPTSAYCAEVDLDQASSLVGVPGILPDGRTPWTPVDGETQRDEEVVGKRAPHWDRGHESAENAEGGS